MPSLMGSRKAVLLHRPAAVPAGWTPANLTDSIWFDFSDATTMTSDGSTQITDTGGIQTIQAKGSYSTLPQLTQTTAANKPIWSSSGYADFDGTNDELSVTSALFTSGISNEDEVSVFAYLNNDAVNTTGVSVCAEGYESASNPITSLIRKNSITNGATNHPYIRNDAGTVSDTVISTGTPFAVAYGWARIGVTLKRSTTTMTHWIDGSQDSTTSSWSNPGGTYAIDNFCIGAFRRNGSFSSYYNGQLAQIVIVPSILSTDDIGLLDTFFTNLGL